jgi:hypothetical protein
MKKGKREPYRELAKLVGLGLCNFCKFADWDGSSCCDPELECTHPLDVVNGGDAWEAPHDVWQGSDCWGFRPNVDLQTAGVIVGIMLEGNMPHKSKRYGEYIAIIPSDNDKRELTLAGQI